MKVIVNGAAGRMGKEILALVEKEARGSVLAFAADRDYCESYKKFFSSCLPLFRAFINEKK